MKKGRLEEAIELARKQGHHIKVRKRADGGYRITEIDGVKYTGSSGNNAIRAMTGTGGLTRKQQSSLKKNRKKVTKALSKSESKLFDKINKQRAKAGLKKIKKVKARKVKKGVHGRGGKKRFEEMLSRMRHSIIKKLGFAEHKNVLTFIARLETYKTKPNQIGSTFGFTLTIKYLKRNLLFISDDSLMRAYDIAYEYDKGYIEGYIADLEMLEVFKEGVKKTKEILKEESLDLD